MSYFFETIYLSMCTCVKKKLILKIILEPKGNCRVLYPMSKFRTESFLNSDCLNPMGK